MSELRYPNESREYRDARESLLKDEKELIDKIKSVAERRRALPPGGQAPRLAGPVPPHDPGAGSEEFPPAVEKFWGPGIREQWVVFQAQGRKSR